MGDDPVLPANWIGAEKVMKRGPGRQLLRIPVLYVPKERGICRFGQGYLTYLHLAHYIYDSALEERYFFLLALLETFPLDVFRIHWASTISTKRRETAEFWVT